MTQARVNSIEALREWQETLAKCRASAQDALLAVEMDIRRHADWLDDQRRYWQLEIRRVEEKIQIAKSDLWRKKNMPIISNPDYYQEEKIVRRLQQRLDEAEAKLELTRKWAIAMQRAIEEYEGPGKALTNVLETDLPRALAQLEKRIAALEAYLAVAPPAPPVDPAPPQPRPEESS
ncbi:MAG: hypothetical protein JNM56_26130 [Planctomycetia bacterium]|nr:hypothetical protein [Planctomycetia bacterium]